MGTPIEQLLQEPLGKPAYWDVDILTDECKSGPNAVLTLYNVMLSCGNKPTGLTYCEATQPEYDQKFFRDHDLLVRGVLVIKKPGWLTPEGRRALTKELRERDDNARRAAGRYDAPSDLTVGKVFGLRRKPKVWIQIRKRHHYATQYMLSDKVPDGLCLWIDPGRGRYFRIDSMDSETAHRSQLFFARYRVVHDMKELVSKAEQQNLDSIGPKVRDPDWFIEQYMRYKYTGPSGDKYDDIKNKVRELFLEHYEWLVRDQSKQKNNRLFDPAAWRQWRKKQIRQRDPDDLEDYSEDEPMVVDDEIAEDDGMEEDVSPPRQSRRTSGHSSRRGSAAPLQNAGRKRQLSPDLSRPPSLGDDNEIQRGYESSGLEYIDNPGALAEPDYYRPSSDDSDVENYLLDGDFSSDEAPPQSDTDSDDYVQSQKLTEPAVMTAIPYVLTLSPRIPLAGARWYCPVRDCSHDINMYDLSHDHPTIFALSKRKRDWIRSGGWSWQDPNLVDCFEVLVSAHYQEHLDELGIDLAGGRRDIVARWKHPAEHPSKHGKVIVKKERQTSARLSTAFDIKPEPSQ